MEFNTVKMRDDGSLISDAEGESFADVSTASLLHEVEKVNMKYIIPICMLEY
jgi:hypothetical protein